MYRIFKNEKTITVALFNVNMNNVNNLINDYKKPDGTVSRFGSGIIQEEGKQAGPLLRDIAKAFSEVTGRQATLKDFYEGGRVEYPLFRSHKQKVNDELKKTNQIEVNINLFNKKESPFYEDLKMEKNVTDLYEVLNHYWGIELEIGASKNEDKIYYVVTKRILMGKEKPLSEQYNGSKVNDGIWEGFDFGDKKSNANEVETIIPDEDMPF